ncbi:MAG: ABC transporter substrate-binding protein [Lachnospiraceae bacterium]|nr:ABC transporter substrate-binding protein [Lachnospiraceae bacterium]
MDKRRKMMLFSLLMTLAMAIMTGCGGNEKKEDVKGSQETADESQVEENKTQEDEQQVKEGDRTKYPLTITDSLGNEVTIQKEPERVVSLAPADTEILFALGAGDRVKGRTDYCSYPEEASEVESIGTYTSPNTELILSMEPDVIFASDYIDDSIKEQVESTGAKTVVFSANSVEEVQDVILQAGQILNLNEKAKELTDSMKADLKELQDTVASVKAPKSVFVDIGSFYSAGPGSLLADMLDKMGVNNIAADTEEAYPQISVEAIIEKNPDIYLSLYSTPEEIKKTAGLNELECIKNDNIIFYEALSEEADVVQRPSPRVVEGMRLLAEQIYPDLFQ